MKSWVLAHKPIAVFLLIVLVVAAVLFVWVETSRAPGSTGELTPTIIVGEVVCLPHKEGGPQTAECAYGIKLEDGIYYALRDPSEKYENIGKLPMGKRVRLTGTLKPEPSDIYKSTGTFTFTGAEEAN